MSTSYRLVVALGLAGASLAACAAPAARAAPAPAADSARGESPPAPLIRPPAPPPITEPKLSPDDTAMARVRAKAREAYGRGRLLEQQQAYSGAIISYMNAARMDPTLKGPSLRIGFLYASRQQWDPAARAFREELRRDPGSRVAAREYAMTLAELGDTTRAIRMLEDLTRSGPSDAAAWRALGFAYTRAGRYEAAEKALRGAVGLRPKYALAWRDLGVVLAARDKTTDARDAYRRALAADSTDETTLVNLANLESRLGNHDRALALYRDAERRDTTQVLAYRGQIAELVALGREADAGAVWRRWLARFPDDQEVRESAARHFVRVGRPDVALAIAREGVRLRPSAGQSWWLVGEVQQLAGDDLGALSAYREAGARFREPADLARNEASIAELRAGAPDSLRARFRADSMTHAARDTTRRAGR